MTFTDDDIESLLHATEGYGFKEDIKALLTRLKAAESILQYAHICCADDLYKLDNLIKDWEKIRHNE